MECGGTIPQDSFGKLPAELIFVLFCYVPSPTALYRLLQASRRCSDVFRSFKRQKCEVLQHVLENDLEPALHSQALAVWESTKLASWDESRPIIQSSRDAEQILGHLTESRREGANDSIEPRQVVAICHLHCAIELFIRDYTLHALPLFKATECKAIHSQGGSKQDGSSSKVSAHLSKLETSRLQRAFMNFELMCNIVRVIGPVPIGWEHNVTFHRIISVYSASEWEEVLCVVEHLHARVEEVFDELEQEYVQAICESRLDAQEVQPWAVADDDEEAQTMTETAASYLRGETCLYYGLRSTKQGLVRTYHARHLKPKELCKPSPDGFYARRIKRSFHRSLANVLIGNGLTYLMHLLYGGAKAQREAVKSILESGCNKFPDSHIFSKWLDREHDHSFVRRVRLPFQRRNPGNPPPPGQATHTVQNPIQTTPNPPPPQLVLQHPPPVSPGRILPDDDHDQLSRPNLGWHWSRNYLHSDISGRPADYALRRWGYVFWDADRLRAMGVTDWVHDGSLLGREVQKRRRDEELSAEQVLVDMGLLAESPVNLSLTTETMPPEVERRVRARWDDWD